MMEFFGNIQNTGIGRLSYICLLVAVPASESLPNGLGQYMKGQVSSGINTSFLVGWPMHVVCGGET
jgi:hypothetical protein